MNQHKQTILRSFNTELGRAHAAWRNSERKEAWRALERAHVLSQAFVWPHTKVHTVMLYYAVWALDPIEILGQLMRVVLAAPSSFFGAAPQGNVGSSRVSAFVPMPIEEDLQNILAGDERAS